MLIMLTAQGSEEAQRDGRAVLGEAPWLLSVRATLTTQPLLLSWSLAAALEVCELRLTSPMPVCKSTSLSKHLALEGVLPN